RVFCDGEIMRFITPVKGTYTAVVPSYHLMNQELFSRLANMPVHIAMGLNDSNSLGAGWGEVIRIEKDQLARRSSRKAFFYLPSAQSQSARLVLEVIGAPAVDISVTVVMNDMILSESIIEKNITQRLELPLPEKINDSHVLEGVIINKQTWQPDKVYRNNDYREFGIMVSSIALLEQY
ncbi:MAG: hypothetical protein NT030_08660, partial [Candidatus Saganbacteria bacterium]|nr:hypothetical protein [Candidatus Saganbacteria bacterium]